MDFRLFGVIRGVEAGSDVGLGPRRQRQLLALLALETGRVLPVRRLVELLWPDEPPDSATHTIRVWISRLRSAVGAGPAGEPLIQTHAGGYRLAADRSAVDVLAFEDLVGQGLRLAAEGHLGSACLCFDEALAYWTDEPLVEFPDDPVAVATRRNLRGRRHEALQGRAEARSALAEPEAAAEDLRTLLDENPLRENAWRLLASITYREGSPAEGLEVCRQARERLVEVGLDPSPELAELEVAMLRQDPSLRVGAQPAIPHNLPYPVDAFIGRHAERESLVLRLRRKRLVTLTGPGGSGKTRLALEVARTLLDHHDGVRLVELASVDHESVPAALAAAVAGGPSPAKLEAADLASIVGERDLLLILDECEHVVAAVADVAAALLRQCGRLRILATSRVALRAPGESIHPVGPLSTPPVGGTADDLRDYDAALLLLDRLGLDGPGGLDDVDVVALTSLLQRLDGMPLAIELAAARLAEDPAGSLAAAVAQDVPLGEGYRTAVPRHRTLRATLEWSLAQIEPGQRRDLSCLAVFQGDFGSDAAAAAIGQDGVRRFELLATDSLLVRLSTTPPRYRLLEPVRLVAQELLERSGEAEAVRRRRDDHFMDLARDLAADRGFERPDRQRRFLAERTHFLAAVEHLGRAGRFVDAATMATNLASFLLRLGLYDTGSRMLASLLERPEELPQPQMDALQLHLAWILSSTGEHHAVDQLVDRAVAHGTDVEDVEWSNLRGSDHAERGHLRLAATHLRRSLELAGPDRIVALPRLLNLSAVLAWQGDIDGSAALADRARTIEHGSNRGLFHLLDGIHGRMRGDLPAADASLDAAVQRLHGVRSESHLAMALAEHALVAAEQAEPDRVEQFAAAVRRLWEQPGRAPAIARVRVHQSRAVTAAARGDSNAFRQEVDALLALWAGSGTTSALVEAAELVGLGGDWGIGQATDLDQLVAMTDAMREQTGLARDAFQQQRRHHYGPGEDGGQFVEATSVSEHRLAGAIAAAVRGPSSEGGRDNPR